MLVITKEYLYLHITNSQTQKINAMKTQNLNIEQGQKILFLVTDYRMEPAISKMVTRKVQGISYDCGKNVIGYLINQTGSGSGYETILPEQVISVK